MKDEDTHAFGGIVDNGVCVCEPPLCAGETRHLELLT